MTSLACLQALPGTHPFFLYMESRQWGQCQHCQMMGNTFCVSQKRKARLCKECSRLHAPWMDATLMERKRNSSHSNLSDSTETESSEDSGQQERTRKNTAEERTRDGLHLLHFQWGSSDNDTDREDYINLEIQAHGQRKVAVGELPTYLDRRRKDEQENRRDGKEWNPNDGRKAADSENTRTPGQVKSVHAKIRANGQRRRSETIACGQQSNCSHRAVPPSAKLAGALAHKHCRPGR